MPGGWGRDKLAPFIRRFELLTGSTFLCGSGVSEHEQWRAASSGSASDEQPAASGSAGSVPASSDEQPAASGSASDEQPAASGSAGSVPASSESVGPQPSQKRRSHKPKPPARHPPAHLLALANDEHGRSSSPSSAAASARATGVSLAVFGMVADGQSNAQVVKNGNIGAQVGAAIPGATSTWGEMQVGPSGSQAHAPTLTHRCGLKRSNQGVQKCG